MTLAVRFGPPLLGVVLTLASASVGAARVHPAPASPHPGDSLTSTVRAALARSAVPVLLPATLPATIGPLRAVSVMRADRTGYYVGFSSVSGCAGAHSCAAVHVGGSVGDARPEPPPGQARRIVLPDARPAWYIPRDCSGENCSEASLTFVRGRISYEIDANAAPDDLPIIIAVYRRLRLVSTRERG